MPIHTASAEWRGNLKEGEGKLDTGSGIVSAPYTFASRFEKRARQTNPEELVGAAHAGCFTMAVVAALDRAGHRPERIRTEAQVALERNDEGPYISYVELHTEAVVPGITPDKFQTIAQDAKANCVISRALRVDIRLTANLVSGPGVGGNR